MFLWQRKGQISQTKFGLFLAFNHLVWLFSGLFLALFGFLLKFSTGNPGQGQVAKLASGLFYCWSSMCNNTMATNLLMFTSSYNIVVLPLVTVNGDIWPAGNAARQWLLIAVSGDVGERWHFPLAKARNQLGTPGGAKYLSEGPNFFELCPIVSNYNQQIFPGRAKNFLGGLRPPWLRACPDLLKER